MIHFQPKPKIPPIGFFQPISADPKDMMTDVEFLLGVLKKLNEVIAQVNKDSELIGEIDGLKEEVNAMRAELTQFEADINNEISTRFNNIVIELNAIVATALVQANAYTDSKAQQLENEIQEIVVGQITVYDPTTGIRSPLQTVIDNLYNSSRDEACTATEYDGYELTATTYDGYEITAADYDSKGKTIIEGYLG